MKNTLLILLLCSIIFCTACRTNAESAETTALPETTHAPETTQAPEPEPGPVEVKIFESGTTDYSIVFEDVSLAQYAFDLSNKIYSNCNIKIPVKNIITVTPENDKIITLGEIEGVSDTSALSSRSDFMLKISENRITLAATNTLSYDYLCEYLLREVFSKTENGTLTLTTDDDIVYSSSELFSTTYVDYWKAENGNVTKEFSAEICEEYYYESRYGITMAYRLYLPSNYDENKDYPVFIYLHGAGHRGSDNAATVSNIVYNFFNHENVPMDETIVLIPQCPEKMQWVNQPWANGNYTLKGTPESIPMKTLVSLIYDIQKEYSTDESRYYLYGMSMGGFGVWDLAARHSKLFAGVYPVCGGGPTDAANILKNIPIWTIHSDDDTTVPFAGSEEMVNAIKDAGGEQIFFKRLTGYNHAIGTVSATDSEIFEWLFAQKK